MKKFDRFDMEQQIMTCWSVCEDLDTLCEGVLDREMNTDKIANVIVGMKDLYHLKFEKLWDQFESMCREYCELEKFHTENTMAAVTAKKSTKAQVKNYESEGSGWPFAESRP